MALDDPTSLLTLSSLFTQAAKGDELARAAMPAAKEEFMPPPMPDGSTAYVEPPVTVTAEESQLPAGTQASGGERESGLGSFLKSQGMQDTLKAGLGGLLGAGIGSLIGKPNSGAFGFASGVGTTMKDIADRRAEQEKRRQVAWSSAYEDARSLPQEVYTAPNMQELVAAQQALMKDLADGKIDNEKTLSNWLLTKQKYAGDIEDLKVKSELQRKLKIQGETEQAELMRKEQEAVRYREIAADPSQPEALRQQAEAMVAQYDQAKNELKLKQEQAAAQKAQQERLLSAQLEENKLRQQQMGIQQQLLTQRGATSAANIKSKETLAKLAAFNKAWQDELNNRVTLARTQGLDYSDVEKGMIDSHRADILHAAEIKLTSPGNISIAGEEMPLVDILGSDPAMWDAGGTPSRAGWDRILVATIPLLKNKGMQAQTMFNQTGEDLRLSNLGQ